MEPAATLLSTDATQSDFAHFDLSSDIFLPTEEVAAPREDRVKSAWKSFFSFYQVVAPDTEIDTTVIDLASFREQKNSQIAKPNQLQELPYEEDLRRFARSQIARLRGACDNWDGHGAKTPEQTVLQVASYLIDKWDWTTTIAPEIGPLSDGAVCFEFYDDNDNLLGALDVLGEGMATYAFTFKDAGDSFGEIDPRNPSDRARLFDLLKKAKAARE